MLNDQLFLLQFIYNYKQSVLNHQLFLSQFIYNYKQRECVKLSAISLSIHLQLLGLVALFAIFQSYCCSGVGRRGEEGGHGVFFLIVNIGFVRTGVNGGRGEGERAI